MRCNFLLLPFFQSILIATFLQRQIALFYNRLEGSFSLQFTVIFKFHHPTYKKSIKKIMRSTFM